MTGLPATPLAPAWVVLPLAGLTLLVLAGYGVALQWDDMPPKRRRIRTANTVLMMFTTPLLAYGFAIVTPSNARLFLLTWLAIMGLVAMMILLAGLDALHTLQLHRQQRREIRAALRAARGGPAERAG